jgi:branched-chain amino acid transport system ATP-binding protein
VVLVEQNAQAAVEIADKTFVLEDGKIVLSGGRELMNNSKIKNIYFAGAKIN